MQPQHDFFKIERKEGSVYVYESDDGINFTLITTIALTLTNPFNVGLAITNTTSQTTTAQFEQVNLLIQPTDTDVEVIQNIGPAGGTISVEFAGATREVIFPAGAVLTEVPVKVTLSTTPNTTYPDDEQLRSLHPPDQLKYISPLMTVEMPLNTLDWQNPDSLKQLMFLDPGFYEGTYNEDLVITAEIRIQTIGGADGLQFDYYWPGEPIGIIAAQLSLNYSQNSPEILKLSEG